MLHFPFAQTQGQKKLRRRKASVQSMFPWWGDNVEPLVRMEEDVGLHQHQAVSFVDNDKCIVNIKHSFLDSARDLGAVTTYVV